MPEYLHAITQWQTLARAYISSRRWQRYPLSHPLTQMTVRTASTDFEDRPVTYLYGGSCTEEWPSWLTVGYDMTLEAGAVSQRRAFLLVYQPSVDLNVFPLTAVFDRAVGGHCYIRL